MIIDVNACLGHYPFRSLRFNTAATMLGLMDRNGIDRAVVSSLHAVFYRDAHRGNAELLEETKPHGSRFIPVATVNPKYVGWERDLAEAVEQWKMRVVTLMPEHHGYSLADEHGRAALARIARYGVPVLLTQRFEDRRQRHHWDRAEDLQAGNVLDAARAHPTLKFLLANWLGLDGAKLVDAGLKGRCLIDIARMAMVYRKDGLRLIDTLGVEGVAFGSHMPFDYVGPSLVKLADIEKLRPAEYEAIAWRNASKFLGIGS
jgi:predicted TIM-barrel fold metal-dependent hydrolase